MPFLFLHSSIAGRDLCAEWDSKIYIGFTHIFILQGSLITARIGLKKRLTVRIFPNCQSYFVFTILYLYLPALCILKAASIQTPQIS